MGQWYIRSNGQEQGPLSVEQMKLLASSGRLKPDDPVRKAEAQEWVRADRLKGLFPEVAVPSPKPPPLATPKPTGIDDLPDAPGAQADQELPNAPAASVPWTQRTWVVLLSLLILPLGLFFVWRHPAWSKGKKWAFTGLGGAFFVYATIQGQKEQERVAGVIAQSNSLWDAGKKQEALALYTQTIEDDETWIKKEQASLVYSRVIDHSAESGNREAAQTLIKTAESRGVVVVPESNEAKTLLVDLQKSRTEEKKKLAPSEDSPGEGKATIAQETQEPDSRSVPRGQRTYKVSKGFLSGSLTVELPEDEDLGIEFSDFKVEGGMLSYTITWDAMRGGSPRHMRWSAYDSKGVKVDGMPLDFGDTIRSGEPTRGKFYFDTHKLEDTVRIKIE